MDDVSGLFRELELLRERAANGVNLLVWQIWVHGTDGGCPASIDGRREFVPAHVFDPGVLLPHPFRRGHQQGKAGHAEYDADNSPPADPEANGRIDPRSELLAIHDGSVRVRARSKWAG